jgi:hypothetical protein
LIFDLGCRPGNRVCIQTLSNETFHKPCGVDDDGTTPVKMLSSYRGDREDHSTAIGIAGRSMA